MTAASEDVAGIEALAKRCEEATGADRELDAAIRTAAGVHPRFVYARAYTASLDAAMTLVPEGCLFTVRTLWDGPVQWGYAYVMIYADSGESSDGKVYVDERAGIAATPALALCAAALRAYLQARASTSDQGEK